MPIWIDFCVNDENNGVFTGKVCRIQFGIGCITTLDPLYVGGHAFRDNGGTITFCRRRWPYRASNTWVGNWCWDAYCFDWPVALRLLRAIKASGKWRCTGGPALTAGWFDERPKGALRLYIAGHYSKLKVRNDDTTRS